MVTDEVQLVRSKLDIRELEEVSIQLTHEIQFDQMG